MLFRSEAAQAAADRTEVSDVADPATDEFSTPEDEEGTPPRVASWTRFPRRRSAGKRMPAELPGIPESPQDFAIPAQGLEPY